jgi:hypothetical protein
MPIILITIVTSKHSFNLLLVIVDSGASPCKSLTKIAVAKVNGNAFLVQCILNFLFHVYILTTIAVVPPAHHPCHRSRALRCRQLEVPEPRQVIDRSWEFSRGHGQVGGKKNIFVRLAMFCTQSPFSTTFVLYLVPTSLTEM